jgi:hypothetical protein
MIKKQKIHLKSGFGEVKITKLCVNKSFAKLFIFPQIFICMC